MDRHDELVERKVSPDDLRGIEACLDRHRRERLQKDPFESVDWGASFCRMYPKAFGAALVVVVLSASYVAFTGTIRAVLASLFLLALLTAVAASVAMLFHPLARVLWRTLSGGTPLYDSLVARVAVNGRTIAELQTLPPGALDVYRRALVIEHERLHARQLMIWGTKISAVAAVLWSLKPAIDLSNGLGSLKIDTSQAMSEPWLALWGLILVLGVVLLPRLHVERLKMHAELLAGAIETKSRSVVTEVTPSEKHAVGEGSKSAEAAPGADDEDASAAANNEISLAASALGRDVTRA